MAGTRIYVDSVLDRDSVRVLISTDGKTETPIIMEMKALEKLLRDKKELWKKFEIRRKGETQIVTKLIRNIEGEVVTFDETETPFFEKLVKDFRRPPRLTDESDVKRVKKDRIKDDLKEPRRSRRTLPDLIERKKKLRIRRRRPR